MVGLQAGVQKVGLMKGRSWPFHLLLIVSSLLVGIPVIYAILVATQTNAETFSFQLTPGSAIRANFESVWILREFGVNMWNSTVQAVLVTVGKTIFALMAGLAFVYFKFRGKWIIFFFVLITLMMPTEVMVLAMFRLVSGLGWQNTIAGIVVPFLASATGAFLFRQHFANLPVELLEAAQIDGATPIKFLTKILIPLSWNVIGALAVIQFVYSWNMYLWPRLIINDQSAQVVQVGIATLLNVDGGLAYGPLMMAAVIASIPPTIIFIALQKPFMSGFGITADK